MKKLSFFLLAFSFFTTANAQIVNIPDAIFKAKLLEASTTNNYTAKDLAGNYFKIDANNDGEIQETEALEVTSLSVNGYSNNPVIESLEGIRSFTNLKSLSCTYNQITFLDLRGLTNLSVLICFENQLQTLNISGLTNLSSLECWNNKISDLNLTGLSNLQSINCFGNKISILNLTGLTNLEILDCYDNQITTLDFTGLSKIYQLLAGKNPIESIDLSQLPNLKNLWFGFTPLRSLDLSKLNKLISFNVSSCPNLETINLKNGSAEDLNSFETDLFEYLNTDCSNFSSCPNLKYICGDESELVSISQKIANYNYTKCNVGGYCSFEVGGIKYTIQGNQKLDSNNNGCDANDVLIPNLKYTIESGTTVGSIIVDASGNYSITVQAGTHTITPVFENPTYFTVSPTTVNITFPTQTSPFTQNFCITPNGVRPDLEVTLLPLQPARPGFDAKYKLVYKNKGNTIQSGSVNLTFADAVLDLVVANPVATTQTTNNLSWNFTNLQPFETREITFTMNVNSPMETPAVNNDDVLAFSATITSSATDETPTDNTFTFNQTVVGSYDPNDKTCLEGSVITPALIGQYVHYTIRFENTGTFAAENVVVKDMIDLTKFDISTLVPTSTSHSYVSNISLGNKVEFIFENINLPFDDANNDGYIAFKIKTKPTLVVNDSFSNEASIYFDYNFPILTNKATSTFKTLGTPDFDFDRYFTVYPIPAKSDLNISAKETINVQSMGVYNTLGQLVLVVTNAEKTTNIDVSSLPAGNYFLQIKTDKGSSTSNFIKK